MTATAPATPSAPAARSGPVEVDPGFGAALGSEWLKLCTDRSVRRNLVLGTVLSVAVSALLLVLATRTFTDWTDAQRADFDPLLYPLAGTVFLAIFFAAAGVNVVASEHASGMFRLTCTATPRRGRVLAAKVLVVVLATGAAGLVATVAMLVGGQAILATGDAPSVGLLDGELWRTVALLAVVGPVLPVVAVTVAVLLRSSAASLSAVLALVFAPAVLGALLPAWWQRNVLSLLPGPAGDAVAIGHLDRSPLHLHPVAGAVVSVAWVVVLWGLARVAVCRRDA